MRRARLLQRRAAHRALQQPGRRHVRRPFRRDGGLVLRDARLGRARPVPVQERADVARHLGGALPQRGVVAGRRRGLRADPTGQRLALRHRPAGRQGPARVRLPRPGQRHGGADVVAPAVRHADRGRPQRLGQPLRRRVREQVLEPAVVWQGQRQPVPRRVGGGRRLGQRQAHVALPDRRRRQLRQRRVRRRRRVVPVQRDGRDDDGAADLPRGIGRRGRGGRGVPDRQPLPV